MAGGPWRPPKLVEVPGYYNDRASWEAFESEDDESEGMYAWLDEVIDEQRLDAIDIWLQNRPQAVEDDGTRVKQRISDLTAPKHDDMSLLMVVMTDTRPQSVATLKELMKEMPDRAYRDRRGRTALDHLRLAMTANPGNAVLQQKYDLYQSSLDAAKTLGALSGVSKKGFFDTPMGDRRVALDKRNLDTEIASYITGQAPGTPVLIQKSVEQSKAGLSGVKGARRNKTRKSRKGKSRKGKTRGRR